MAKKFYSHLRYSFGNEDWRTEEEALNIQPEDHVLCVTASGDRPLNLLTRECQRIVCIDANPVQNHLLQLKTAAMKALDYESYLSFLGAAPCSKRKETLNHVIRYLDHNSAQFWKKRERLVANGVIYQGAVERLLRFVSKVFAVLRGKKVKRLFNMNNLEEQRKFVREEWDSYILRKCFNVIINSFIFRILIEDPGLTNRREGIKPANYFYDRINASLDRELAKNNPLLSLILKGKVSKEAYSPYLTEVGVQAIKPRLSVLEIQTKNILDYLDSFSVATFDVFSLSDVASYLSYPDFIRLLNGIVRTAKPGARFCLRQLMSYYEIPQHLKHYFVRDSSLEQRLEKLDVCFVYNFMVGTIAAPANTSRGQEKQLAKV